jgi:gas vesicle protein
MIMKEELTNKGNSILMPFLVGGVVGAGVALLLAPKPGKEVREDIKRFATSTKDRVTLIRARSSMAKAKQLLPMPSKRARPHTSKRKKSGSMRRESYRYVNNFGVARGRRPLIDEAANQAAFQEKGHEV